MNKKRDRTIAGVIYILVILKHVTGQNVTLTPDDDLTEDHPGVAKLNFTITARSYGYIAEEHTVTTEDGYVITMFRIPKGKRCLGRVRQPPVLLMHGLLVDSDSWLDAGPSAGLAFLLSDACYDLWVGNVRGTIYGRKHVLLDPDTDSEFWDFTSHEMGKYDIPAFIDYMLNRTNSSSVIYVGHSQGSRLLYVTCSERNEYCGKVKLFISMAPAVRLLYTRSVPFRLFARFYKLILPLLTSPAQLEVLPRGGPIQKLAFYICRDFSFAFTVCKLILNLIDSYDPLSISTQTVRVLYNHTPSGTSARSLAFYAQNEVLTFNMYDYGADKNLNIYGNTEPPKYNLNRTTVPVIIIYSRNDYLVDPKDVLWLATQLPNIIETYQVINPKWNHIDYIYSQFTRLNIFPKINQYLLKYTN